MDKVSQPRPLFMIGNKRSGTSHLVRLVNLPPNVFVTHESEIIWVLYQAAQGVPFTCYPWDGPMGMQATLKACADFLYARKNLDKEGRVRDVFFRV